MDLEAQLNDLAKRVKEHREVLLTEEAAKNALVMPFIRALGYDVFNPSEVVPEFTCDVGIKKGEKVDYAIYAGGAISLLIECKPVSGELRIEHASQLYRYFSATDARLAILTNGVIYKFFCDHDAPNKMDDKPFFTFDLENVRKSDIKTLTAFSKDSFNVEQIISEAGKLKSQTLVAAALTKEFSEPSDEFVRVIAAQVSNERLTAANRDLYRNLIVASVQQIIRDRVNDRLTSALTDSHPLDEEELSIVMVGDIETTQDELDGFNIVRAICSRAIDPKRVVLRDSKSYCAILLDDNNRKTLVRLHFNSLTSRYAGVFQGKEETRHAVTQPLDLYQLQDQILARVDELGG